MAELPSKGGSAAAFRVASSAPDPAPKTNETTSNFPSLHSLHFYLDGGRKMSGEWCTIESDPGVFTSLVESFGVKNVECELFSYPRWPRRSSRPLKVSSLFSPSRGVTKFTPRRRQPCLFFWAHPFPPSTSRINTSFGALVPR